MLSTIQERKKLEFKYVAAVQSQSSVLHNHMMVVGAIKLASDELLYLKEINIKKIDFLRFITVRLCSAVLKFLLTQLYSILNRSILHPHPSTVACTIFCGHMGGLVFDDKIPTVIYEYPKMIIIIVEIPRKDILDKGKNAAFMGDGVGGCVTYCRRSRLNLIKRIHVRLIQSKKLIYFMIKYSICGSIINFKCTVSYLAHGKIFPTSFISYFTTSSISIPTPKASHLPLEVNSKNLM